jgi:hypothetical protein
LEQSRTLKREKDERTAVKGSKNLKPFEFIIQHLIDRRNEKNIRALAERTEYTEKNDVFFPALPETKKINLCDLCELEQSGREIQLEFRRGRCSEHWCCIYPAALLPCFEADY